MATNYGMSNEEIDTLHIISPEMAAHNIALAYVSSSARPNELSEGEDVNLSDVLSLSNQYAEAYNYAYNFITHENELIKAAE